MILIIIGVLAFAFYYFLVKPLNYWKEKNVPFRRGVPFLGNAWPIALRRLSAAELYRDLCQEFSDKRYIGIHNFTSPVLLVQDPDLIKRITIKDFDTFPEHRNLFESDVDPMWNKNLFSMEGGERWHEMRATLSPSFTSSKMKAMFALIKECSHQFTNFFVKKGDMVTVELKDAFSRFAIDVIASAAFGVKCDSLEHPNNEFYIMGKSVLDFKGYRGLIFMMNIFIPTLAKVLRLPLLNKNIVDFFQTIVQDTVKFREEKNIIRADVINLLMLARKGQLSHDKDASVPEAGFAVVEESEIGKNEKKRKLDITDEDITAQALLFFIAGFESVSTMMCYTVYELALQPDIQHRLQSEVDDGFDQCGGDLSYDSLMQMKYLDQIVSETLRKWPSFVTTNRKCVRPFTIEPVHSDEHTVHLEPGNVIAFPLYAIQRNEKYFSNPDHFDPDRFSDENKKNIVPYTYMPFGAGPRSCIGSRFALMEGKLIIAELVRKFEFVVVEKTQIPIVLGKTNFLNPVPEDGFWVGLRPRTH